MQKSEYLYRNFFKILDNTIRSSDNIFIKIANFFLICRMFLFLYLQCIFSLQHILKNLHKDKKNYNYRSNKRNGYETLEAFQEIRKMDSNQEEMPCSSFIKSTLFSFNLSYKLKLFRLCQVIIWTEEYEMYSLRQKVYELPKYNLSTHGKNIKW